MKVLFIDTETTALVANSARQADKQPHIIEFCGMFKGQLPWSQVFSIPIGIPPEVTKITGFKDGDLVGCPRFHSLAERIKGMIEEADRVVAHNLSYDKFVVDTEFLRLKKTVQWPELFCTVEATEYMKGYRLSLSALYAELFGKEFSGAHRAVNDVNALAECYVALEQRGMT